MAPRREDLGSWLGGTPGGDGAAGGESGGTGPGLPPEGPGSVARLPRRLLGVGVDWVLSMAVSAAFFPDPDAPNGGLLQGRPLATLAVFLVSTAVLVGLAGNTVGHRLARLRVLRVPDARAGVDRPPGLIAGLVRTVLLGLVVPPAIWDKDGRGLHDAAAGTVIVRR